MRSALAGILAVLLAALFLYSVTDGNLTVGGDDMFVLAGVHGVRPGQSYISEAAGRAYLLYTYVNLHRALGSSTRNTHLFFLALHAINSVLCFLVLRKLTGLRPALLGSLFYLAYTGKYETLPHINGGLYLLVMTVFFLSAWIALSKGNPWFRWALIAVLNWLAAHLYEIALCVGPLPPLLIAIHRWRRRERIITLDFIPYCLPLAAFLIHFGIMAMVPGRPVWIRIEGMDLSGLNGVGAMLRCLLMGLSASIGINHAGLLLACLRGFVRHVPLTPWYFLSLALCAAAIVVALRWPPRAPDSGMPPAGGHASRTLVLIAAAYLVAIPPVMGFTIVKTAMVTRLISIPAAGLALVLAATVAWAPASARRALLAVLAAGTLAETFAMQSILYQGQVAAALDFSIRDQLRTFALPVRPRDRFHFSFPGDHVVRDFCIAVPSEFATGRGSPALLLDYGMVEQPNSVPLDDRLPSASSFRERGEQSLKMDVPANAGTGGFYPFWVREDGALLAIRDLELVDAGERPLNRVTIPAFASVPPNRTTTARVRAVR